MYVCARRVKESDERTLRLVMAAARDAAMRVRVLAMALALCLAFRSSVNVSTGHVIGQRSSVNGHGHQLCLRSRVNLTDLTPEQPRTKTTRTGEHLLATVPRARAPVQ